jgi:large subunit ribosomal protein L18
MRPEVKKQLCQLRRLRIRKKVRGTAERPRMVAKFTNEHIYVQFIDDAKGTTLASTSTRSKTVPDREKLAANKSSAKVIGQAAAAAAQAQGIQAVVFDRAGARFHGKVKELADAARAAGLKF